MRRVKVSSLLVLCLLVILPSIVLSAELFIPAPTTADDYLNDRIAADTTATGERVDMERVYVLARNGVYQVNDDIRNDEWPLNIKAEAGEGTRPVIYGVTNTTTNTFPDPFFDMRGHVTLKDLIIVGYIEAVAEQISNIPSTFVRSNAAGFDLIIDGCILTQTRGQHVRTESATRLTKFINSVFCNLGDLGRSNFGAGKAIDLRAGSCDSLVMINNTFVNFQDRIVRHRGSTAPINTFIFDHNTVINGMSYHGTIALGWMGDNAIITNNLFYDSFIAGADTDKVRQSEFEEHGEMDPLNGMGRMTWFISVPNDSTEWTVKGNYFTVTDDVQAFYDKYAAAGVTGEGSPLTYHINSKLGADSVTAFVKENLTVANRPAPMLAMAEWYRSPAGGNKTKVTTNFNRATDDFDRQPWQYFDATFDCSYSTTANAYSVTGDGFPAGDLNWFPAKKAEWEEYLTSVHYNPNVAVTDYKLTQNYPNPFNPTTRMSYSLAKTAHVTLAVYNSLGQQVSLLVDNKLQAAGQYDVSWSAKSTSGQMLSSGIYFYKLTVDNNMTMTKKMILMK